MNVRAGSIAAAGESRELDKVARAGRLGYRYRAYMRRRSSTMDLPISRASKKCLQDQAG